MPTPEEINKIAREYAEYVCPIDSYDGDIVERNMDLRICADEALPVLEWLSKDYAIVPKSQIKYVHKMEIQGFEETNSCIFRQRAMLLESIFGKSLFEEK